MKGKKYIALLGLAVLTNACVDLDLNPLSEGSSGTWYSTETEIVMSINDLYKKDFFPGDLGNGSGADSWSDDWIYRETLTQVTNATINGEWDVVYKNYWLNTYKAITRSNTVLANLDRSADKIPEQKLKAYEAEVKFMRATFYSRLIFFFGDVVYYTEPLELEEAFQMSRTDKKEVLKHIYEDYDFAAQYLPVSYSGTALKRATLGAVHAMKARIALYMGDWATAKTSAKACIDMNQYKLYSNFSELFLVNTKQTSESIFSIPRSIELNVKMNIQNLLPRNNGGWAAMDPSWDLFCSFLCADGLPIDESPLFDPHKPFKNRDPRCTATIVEFETTHLGIVYDPNPLTKQVMNYNTGKMITNNDTRSVAQYASYNGTVFKKGVDAVWLQNSWEIAPEMMVIRYADVLMIYAEAKIELNEIDDTVLNAMNQVRARAYGVNVAATADYPAITTTDQSKLRQILRIERRMEFALEGLRYMDLIRWKLAEKALNLPNYVLLDPDALIEKVVNPGGWFFPETPPVDEDGITDFSGMYKKGLIKLMTQRQFDKSRQYLWPIPTKDILINSNLSQNPGY